MAKKQTAPTAQGNAAPAGLIVGLDIGYGAVKAVASDGGSLVFPSVWGAARELKYSADEIAAKYPGDQLTDDEGDFFIGDLALSHQVIDLALNGPAGLRRHREPELLWPLIGQLFDAGDATHWQSDDGNTSPDEEPRPQPS